MNVIAYDDHYEVRLYATGFDKANIKISVVDDILYLSGTRQHTEDVNFVSQEFPVKSFEKMLNLNGKVDVSQISATQTDGVLMVKLPKTKEADKPTQQIQID